MADFERYIGIDYSGARAADSSLKGLRIYVAHSGAQAEEVAAPPGPAKYWTRRGIAYWLALRLKEDIPTLVGMDHSFSFPVRYFEVHRLPRQWPVFLEDFQRHWPTDKENIYVDFVRDGKVGMGAERTGSSRWRRLTDERTTAKSAFHFDVPGSVAKSTHAGLPWLLYIRRALGTRVHFWPFDGWRVPAGKSAMVEAYPALYSRKYPREDRTPDQHDAYSAASWMRDADASGTLREYLAPQLNIEMRGTAEVEGWILGVL